jgi:microsomal dipeptidase-like Zn-dependent dipeptidase
VTVDKVFNMDLSAAFKHAVSLVIIDGLCLGIDVSGDKQKNEILEHCNSFIMKLDQLILENPSY